MSHLKAIDYHLLHELCYNFEIITKISSLIVQTAIGIPDIGLSINGEILIY